MPICDLPEHPSIERFKRDAKSLRDLVRAGFPEAIELVRQCHPRLADLEAGTPAATGFKLADAQLTLARNYELPSWPALRRHVESVNALARSPHQQPVGEPLASDEERADELLRLACLNYGADRPARWEQAATLLDAHPQLARSSVHTMAATGDVAGLAGLLDRTPEAASQEGGPFHWAPLLYLTYSRLERGDALASARLLLDRGADPDAGYLWEGLVPPFTALTGVFGRGEQGAPPAPRRACAGPAAARSRC